MDAKKATKIVLDYFQTVSGSCGPIGFAIESATIEGDQWNVKCSFWDFFGARKRSIYEVYIVDSTESIQVIKKIGEQ
ncbi:MAG: hypothetical protein V1899_00690 [Planctomycetota bacterium]